MQITELKALALTNYGHFTSMRVVDGRVRGLTLHLERLTADCQELFGTSLDIEQVRDRCRQAAEGIDSAVVRVTVFDPELDIGHPGEDSKPEILVTMRPATELPAPPLRVRTAQYSRDAPLIKHVGLFGTLYLRRQAQQRGFDDVLFTDQERIVEGATWNIAFVRDGELIWPYGDVLPGVTMRLLQQAHPHRVEDITTGDLPTVDAAIAANANVGVRVISAIDSYRFAETHDILAQLRQALDAAPVEEL